MAIRIAPLDDNLDFPEAVQQRQAERLADATTAEGAALEARMAAAGLAGYDVILLAGQSNMAGRGTPYTAASDPTNPLIFQYGAKSKTLKPASEPLDMNETSTAGMGPGLQFARWYISTAMNRGRKVLLVPASRGGTRITPTTGVTWNPTASSSLYAEAVAQTKAALAAGGQGSELVAILWLQGESDGDAQVAGPAYQSVLDSILTGFRSDLAAPDVPIIVGQMVPDYLGVGSRQAINAVHVDTPNRLPRTAFAPSPSGPAYNLGDNNHFNAAGQRIIGERMFNAYQKLFAGLQYSSPGAPPQAPVQVFGSTAAQAYSLRKIAEGYSGAAVRVRRSSDGTQQDIGFTTTGELDSAALLAFTGNGDGFVSIWYDQSGNGRPVAQTTNAAQPTIVKAGAVIEANGKPAVQFDGTDDHLFNTAPVLYAAGKASIAAVLTATSQGQSRWWTESVSTANEQYGLLQPDGREVTTMAYPVLTEVFNYYQVAGVLTKPFFDGATHQGVGTDSGSAFSEWIDGAADLSSHGYTRRSISKAHDRFTIGGALRNGSLASLPMVLSEAVYWPSEISDTVRQAATSNQKAYFGTP